MGYNDDKMAQVYVQTTYILVRGLLLEYIREALCGSPGSNDVHPREGIITQGCQLW